MRLYAYMYVHIYVHMRPCVHVLPAGREVGVVGSIYRIPRTEHTIYWASSAAQYDGLRKAHAKGH